MISTQNQKPVFLVTHPRSRSTAFERMFFTRSDDFICELEIFQYPFYYGPERLSQRFEGNENGFKEVARGFEDATFRWALNRIFRHETSHKHVFIKDMAKMICPQDGSSPEVAPSLRGSEEEGIEPRFSDPPNPTIFPHSILQQFHFAFLIRDPRASIPSLYRLSQPPMSHKTRWDKFRAIDAGYAELRALFDYLVATGVIGPATAQPEVGSEPYVNPYPETSIPIVVIESDRLLTEPERMLRQFCAAVGCAFDASMLSWDAPMDKERAETHYLVQQGFHDRVLSSTGFGRGQDFATRPPQDLDECEALWVKEFGAEGAKEIRQCVEENMAHYEYLETFSMK